MKKILLAILLTTFVGAGFAAAQTKPRKRTPVRRAAVKKPVRTPTKIMSDNSTQAVQKAVTTASGLTYIVTKQGEGAQLKAGDEVIVNYTGLLTNGAKFDSSLDRGETFSFPLSAGRVIKGWDEGVQLLRVGDHATLIIPPSIGYGARGAGGAIPPNATLIFLIEVVGVK